MQNMRVLVAHNAYQLRGGEDAVVEAEVALLRSHGHPVIEYYRHNDELRDMRSLDAAIDTLWSRKTGHDLDRLIAEQRPDVIHAHNTFPLISPSLYWAAHRHGIPVVQTLHNFRLLCPQAMFLREGKVCEDCLGKVPWRAVKHACYRESHSQSAALGGMLGMHRALGTWDRKVARYIALNEFSRKKFIEGGLPADRISIKPNFVDFAPPAPAVRSGFLYVGRLAPEKGVSVLAGALSKASGIIVNIAGDGPDGHLLDQIAGVKRIGAVALSEVRSLMCTSIALVLPSICYENFPRTLAEAYGSGLPVIASRIGALAELVDDGVTGLLFKAGDTGDLAEKMRWAQENPMRMAEMGLRARAHFEAYYTAARNYAQLIEIYASTLAERVRKLKLKR